MKYLLCQPDSHNGFVTLSEGKLTYFTIDPTLAALATAGPSPPTDYQKTAIVDGNSVPTASAQPTNALPCGSLPPRGRVHIQWAVELPGPFQTLDFCHSVANRTLYGMDLAIVGNVNGLLAVVAPADRMLVYAPGRDPQSVQAERKMSFSNFHADVNDLLTSGIGKASKRQSRTMPSPSTITWMRNKPLIVVGYSTGLVEWYQVRVQAGHLRGAQQLCKCEAGHPCGGYHTSIPNDGHLPITSVYTNGEGNGVVIDLVASTCLPNSGMLLSSDFFPVNGCVVIGGERAIAVFHTEHLNHPVCYLEKFGCNFLYCHPFLPVVGTLSWGWDTVAPLYDRGSGGCAGGGRQGSQGNHTGYNGGCMFNLLELSGNSTSRRLLHVQQRLFQAASSPRYSTYYSFSWKFSLSLEFALCNVKEGYIHILRLHRLSGPPALGSPRHEDVEDAEAAPAATSSSNTDFGYRFSQARRLRLPVRSLINVEFISAATQSLMSTPPTQPTTGGSLPTDSLSPPSPAFANGVATAAPNSMGNPMTTDVPFSKEKTARFSEVFYEQTFGTHQPPIAQRRSDGILIPFTAIQAGGLCVGCRSPAAIALKEDVIASRMLQPVVTGKKGRGTGGGRRRGGSQPRPGNAVMRPTASSPQGCTAVLEQDLHHVLRVGPGPFSNVVGLNQAGEIALIPVEGEAIATWHGEGSVFVGIGSTVNAAEVASIQGIEREMKSRLEVGFCLSAAGNAEAIRKVNAGDVARLTGNCCGSSHDVRVLFSYIAALESVHAIEEVGNVPSVLALLQMPTATTGLELTPLRTGTAVISSELESDWRRLLLLSVLDWLPSDGASDSPNLSHTSSLADIERAVAVEVVHGRHRTGASILVDHQHRCLNYIALANLLQHPQNALDTLSESDAGIRNTFFESLSPWMQAVFLHLCSSTTDSDSTHYRSRIYNNTQLPLWDRVAIATVQEANTFNLIHTLRTHLQASCTSIQALMLVHGITASAYHHMQVIVDGTGDFQLAACLFARVGGIPPQRRRVHRPLSHSPTLATDSDDATLSGATFPHSPVSFSEDTAEGEESDDCPWRLWVAAYRSFLNHEHAFVERTMFDVACQYLEQRGAEATNPVPAPGSATTPPFAQPATTIVGLLPAYERGYAPPCHTLTTMQPSPSTLPSGQPQRLGMLLYRVNYQPPHCGVCLEPLRPQAAGAMQKAMAWCTVCLHGGHAHHLRDWFRVHRKCPADGCRCHCHEDARLY